MYVLEQIIIWMHMNIIPTQGCSYEGLKGIIFLEQFFIDTLAYLVYLKVYLWYGYL